MNPRRILHTGIMASAMVHLSALLLLLFFTEVHPFGSVTAEPIAVDLVPASEVAPIPKKEEPVPEKEAPVPEPKVKPSDTFEMPSKAEAAPPPAAPPPAAPPTSVPPPAAPPQPAAPRPQRQAALPTPSPSAQPQPQATPPAPQASPTPAYVPPAPDLSIKYHVLLGLPPALPAESAEGKSGDGFDAPASKPADIESSLVTEFRRHLRTCSKLPPSIEPSDNIAVKLRVRMTPEGRLAADPILIEASASAKGPALMQGAMAALQACQPYAMLPADRYREWQVLDLSFTPKDFSG